MSAHLFASNARIGRNAALATRAVMARLTCMLLALFMTLNAAFYAHAQVSQIEEIETQSKDVQSTYAVLNRLSSAANQDDETLVGARVKYQNLILSAEDTIRAIDEQSKAIAERLTEIGPPPEDQTVVEPRTVTQTRSELNRDKSTLAVLKTDLEKTISGARTAIAEINKTRQQAFTEAISKRTALTSGIFADARSSLTGLIAATVSSFSTWFGFVIANRFVAAIGSTLLSLTLALALSVTFNRFFGDNLERRASDPDYFTRVFVAFWQIVLPSIAISIFLAATFSLFSWFDIFNQAIAQITLYLFLVIAGLVFAWHFCKAIFAPHAYEWRLINLPNRSAPIMFWLTFCLFAVYAFDALFTTVNSVMSGPLSLTVLQGVVTAFLIGLILISMAIVVYRRKADLENGDEPSGRFRWDAWIALAIGLSALTIIIAAISGYIGFARFLAQQIVVTGGILSIMYVGIVAARELQREGVLASTGFGQAMLQRGYEPHKIEQAALISGLALVFGILLIGIPALFMQWGTRFEEITAFASAAFTGFDIGGFRLSLSGVLAGLFIFALILLFTRLLQGWLSRSVFPRSKIDQGVSDSIRAGVGYVGFGVAGLMAITSAGLDLSSLAIVAGALSLGIGFGLQNIVSNFVSGLILLVERPIKVGDWIVVGAAEGTVKRISVRATEIETFQRQSIIVPNSELINSQVGNWTFKSKSGRVDIAVGIAYGSDARAAERILYEIAHNHAMVSKKPEPSVWFAGFGDSSLDFRLRVFLYDINNLVTVESEMRFEILRRFEDAGIDIPFPQRDVNLRLMSQEAEAAAAKTVGKPSARKKSAPKRAAAKSAKP